MDKEIIIKFIKNKKTNQFFAAFPKKELDFLRVKKPPKKLKLKIKKEDLIWD